ncbi:MAG: MerR family transcriptional regulator [Actinobacteria bacterium]|nr:MerR family transcriptional regulator [Actinomycetota bacterium]
MADTDYLGVAEVGRRTGLSRKALRVYERMGLVEPVTRTDAGYRQYDQEALRRIELVNRAKVLGLTLTEAKEFLHVAEGCCGDNHPGLAALVERKLEETDRRMAEMQALRGTLQGVVDRLAQNEGRHRCEESLCTCGPLTIRGAKAMTVPETASVHETCDCGCCGPATTTEPVTGAEPDTGCRCGCGCSSGDGCTCDCSDRGCTCGCAPDTAS